MPYTPLQIANTFLTRYAGAAGGIDHMKLQKLDYFVHGWWLAYNADRLLTEQPQVWKYGPVFPSLYRDLKIYGNADLTEPVKVNPFGGTAPVLPNNPDAAAASELLDWVWKRYGHLSALALSDLTHREGTAWRNVAVLHKFIVPNAFPLEDAAVRAEFNAIKEQLDI